jgi:hypothetical protein
MEGLEHFNRCSSLASSRTLSRFRFRAIIGFDTVIANADADTVKFSLITSNVPEGAIRVRKV